MSINVIKDLSDNKVNKKKLGPRTNTKKRSTMQRDIHKNKPNKDQNNVMSFFMDLIEQVSRKGVREMDVRPTA